MMRATLFAVIATAMTVQQAGAEEVKLKAAEFLPARSAYSQPFNKWVAEVNKKCAGKIRISVVGPAAIKPFEQWNALKTGVIDMHYGPSNYYKGVMVESDVLILSKKTAPELRKNGVWNMLNDLHKEKLNAWYLAYFGEGLRFYLYTNKQAKNGRFPGQRLRSMNIYDDFLRGLGARPVRMSPGDVFTGLERGIVDGFGWALWGVSDFGWQKHIKYRYGPGFFNAAINILVNLDKWKSFTDAQRKCLTEMAIWGESQWPKWRDEQDAKELAAQKKAGIKYIDLGPEFPKRAENLYWKVLEKASPAFIKKIRPLISD